MSAHDAVLEPSPERLPDSDALLEKHLFGHERDLIGNLRRFPLVMRYRLDILCLRVPLELWQKFDYETRRTLCTAPFDSRAEQLALTRFLQHQVTAIEGRELEHREPEALADYRQTERVPETIGAALARFKLSIQAQQWAGLSELARFGLAKLSRPGHDNRRLGPLIDDLLYSDFRPTSGA